MEEGAHIEEGTTHLERALHDKGGRHLWRRAPHLEGAPSLWAHSKPQKHLRRAFLVKTLDLRVWIDCHMDQAPKRWIEK